MVKETKLRPIRLWLYKVFVKWLPETRLFGLKSALLRWAGAKVGRNVRINSSATFLGNGALDIGDDVWVGVECLFVSSSPAKITIGPHCDIAPRVMFHTGSHTITPDGEHIGGAGYNSSVTLGSGCWVGARSLILPGVSIADKTIVAAGAVVTKSCPEKCSLIAGVPGKVVKKYV